MKCVALAAHFLLSIHSELNAQGISHNVYVVDTSKQLIEDAYGLNLKNSKHFFQDGKFILTITGFFGDSILIKCIGFESQIIELVELQNLDSVILIKENNFLSEVTVIDQSSFTSTIVGNNKGKRKCTMFGRIKNSGTNDETGLFMSLSKSGYLSDIHVFVGPDAHLGSKFRFNIYQVENGTLQIVAHSPIQIITCEECWHSFSFDSNMPQVSKEIFISIEWLYSSIEVKTFHETKFPFGFGVGLSKSSLLSTCQTKSVIDKNKNFYKSCCGTEEDATGAFNLMLYANLLYAK